MGKFGINKSDEKDTKLLDFLRNNNLHGANTFYKDNKCAADKSFKKNSAIYQIDHALNNVRITNHMNYINVDNLNSWYLDHDCVATKSIDKS